MKLLSQSTTSRHSRCWWWLMLGQMQGLPWWHSLYRGASFAAWPGSFCPVCRLISLKYWRKQKETAKVTEILLCKWCARTIWSCLRLKSLQYCMLFTLVYLFNDSHWRISWPNYWVYGLWIRNNPCLFSTSVLIPSINDALPALKQVELTWRSQFSLLGIVRCSKLPNASFTA